MTTPKLKALQPVEFEPIWAEYEKWGWEKQAAWALTQAGSTSNCRRKIYIEEQLEFAKERREAEALAEALNPMIRQIVKDVLVEVANGAL